MDAEQFDKIARQLSTGTPRRTALKAAAAGTIGGILTMWGRSQTQAVVAHPRCGKGFEACVGRNSLDCCDTAAGELCCPVPSSHHERGNNNPNDGICATDCSIFVVSDRAVKADFATVDGQAVLAQVAALPIQSWRYQDEDNAIRHIGPMAQDFAAAFNVGDDDRHIHAVDGQGVALAAIQGLTQELRALQAENAALAARVADLEGRREA